MQIQVNAADVGASEAILSRVHRGLNQTLQHFEDRITRVEVHLHDLNGRKSGVDKRCLMEARVAGRRPLAVRCDSDDMYAAIDGCASKLERALRHELGRLAARKAS